MIFVNFKTYREGTSSRAVELVQKLREREKEASVPIIPVVQLVDLKDCVAVGGEVWAQHVDPVGFGQNTGWILPEAVKEAGAAGTFLNHSEHKFQLSVSSYQLVDAVKKCKEIGLKTLVFAVDIPELKLILELRPDFVAYEPPELIASETTSVARAKPEIIAEAAKIAKEAGIPLIVGAGVKDAQDVKKSLELGAVGVAVSSAVVLAPDPKAAVLKLAAGFRP